MEEERSGCGNVKNKHPCRLKCVLREEGVQNGKERNKKVKKEGEKEMKRSGGKREVNR